MPNHYHLVLFVNQDELNIWSDEEVMDRWGSLFPTSTLKVKDLLMAADNAATRALYEEKVDLWRKNLGGISWFMRGLNECIARMANKEENCTRRFWEGRFKSQALLDEKALSADQLESSRWRWPHAAIRRYSLHTAGLF